MDNLLRDLQASWSREGESHEARAALQRWANSRGDLRRYGSPAALVRACHSRSDPTAQALVEAITEEAPTDPWATRTVLQALLPGLAGLARQHYDLVGEGREPFDSIGELDQFLVCTAFERITEIAAEVSKHRLRAILDSTWTRLRSHAAAHRRERENRVPLSDAPERGAPPARTGAEELATVLIDAVERRLLRPADAGLVYATRVVGHAPADIAATLACDRDSLVRRRHRVEQLLTADVLGRDRPRGCYVASACS